MLDVKRLTVLREVARRGSFSGAAEALSYTQPAVSQQIAALEREAGVRLVDRGARGIRLTHAGEALVRHTEGILARIAAAEAELEAIAGLRGGRLRLASFPTAGAALLPPAVKAFTHRHPAVELTLIEREPEAAAAAVKQGDIDLAIVFDYGELAGREFEALFDGLELTHLADDPMYIALPLDHPAARRPAVKLAELRDEVWIQGCDDGPCGRLHLDACHAAGISPRTGFQSDDYNVIQGLVAAGVGVSMIPRLALATTREDIAVREIHGRRFLRRIFAANLPGAAAPPAAGAMTEILCEQGARWSARPMIAAA